MSIEVIKVPDIGSDAADVIEVCVSAGDVIEAEDSLVVLESDKSSMEIPAPMAGKVIAVLVSEDDSVSEGAVLIELELADASADNTVSADSATAFEQSKRSK
jgi:pyruvate dehydrogenase E2 component (dihydrolipoamide acetyltransferase)